MKKALLALEDGRTFECQSFTGDCEAFSEVVFNTGMTGYQEILTDPSYKGQMVTMTYPLIGNYGVNPEDIESDRIRVSALLVKEYQSFPNNYRSTARLDEYLKKENIPGVEGLDTRALTRHIRQAGAMRAAISTKDLDPVSLVKRVKDSKSIIGQDLVQKVTTSKPYQWLNGRSVYNISVLDKSIWHEKGKKYSVAVFDFGVKYNILRCLENAGFEIIVLPASTPAETIHKMEPDGIFLSNGPGDPEPISYATETIKKLLDYRPIFGICLGIQLLGLALGGKTYKLKFGHRGSNQPVKNLATGRVEITSQNHGFAVDIETLPKNDIEITHINLNDNTLEGFQHKHLPIFAVQYHPEACPGPHDAAYLFNEFKKLID
ncbi:Carbamoyl phosphate synthase small chain [Candidatus Magnetomoraceae bacterium gMMP-15]